MKSKKNNSVISSDFEADIRGDDTIAIRRNNTYLEKFFDECRKNEETTKNETKNNGTSIPPSGYLIIGSPITTTLNTLINKLNKNTKNKP